MPEPDAGRWAGDIVTGAAKGRKAVAVRHVKGSAAIQKLAAAKVQPLVDALEASRSAGTRRVYASALRQYERWLADEGLTDHADDPEVIALYLAHVGTTKSVSSVRAAKASIKAASIAAGKADPTADPRVGQVIAGVQRQHAKDGRAAPKRAKGLSAEGLAAIRATACQPRSRSDGRTESAERAKARGLVDVALVCLGRDALLRRSELEDVRWGDLHFQPDGSARLRLTRATKSDQTAEGSTLYVGKRCAADLLAIRPDDPDPDAKVFRGLTGESIAHRIQRAAKAAGLGDGFNGHSLRRGMCSDLAQAGASLVQLQQVGRWKSSRMPAIYAADTAAGNSVVAKFYGEDGNGGGQ